VIPLPLGEIAAITGGRLHDAHASVPVTGAVVVDSRQVGPGGLFVCVRGEHSDGHDYAKQAVAAGAVAVLSEQPTGTPAIVVDDVTAALAALARSVRAQADVRVIGVTGSSGKTSTKDLLATIFASVGQTVAPQASYNNELGLPVTVLRLTRETQTLILEYSARGVGHIRYLCGIVPPDVAIVLNVGAAHLGEFGSREAIAVAKGELVEALPANGVAVLNADDPLVAGMATRTQARVVTFGCGADADFQVTGVEVDALARPSFRLSTRDAAADLTLAVHGRHQALNAAAAVAAACAADVPFGVAVDAVQRAASISPHRMQLKKRADGLLVIDDAYNANPDSVRAALTALARVSSGRGRAWAVLGPMRELGEESASMHADIGRMAAELGVAELVVVGADAELIADGAAGTSGWSGQAHRVADVAAATALLADEVEASDVVLVKASNSERLWRVADALAAADVEVRA